MEDHKLVCHPHKDAEYALWAECSGPLHEEMEAVNQRAAGQGQDGPFHEGADNGLENVGSGLENVGYASAWKMGVAFH